MRDALIEDYGCEPERGRVGSGSNIMVHSLDGKRYDRQVALFVGIDFERKGAPVCCERGALYTSASPTPSSGWSDPSAGQPPPISRGCAGTDSSPTGVSSPTSTSGLKDS